VANEGEVVARLDEVAKQVEELNVFKGAKYVPIATALITAVIAVVSYWNNRDIEELKKRVDIEHSRIRSRSKSSKLNPGPSTPPAGERSDACVGAARCPGASPASPEMMSYDLAPKPQQLPSLPSLPSSIAPRSRSSGSCSNCWLDRPILAQHTTEFRQVFASSRRWIAIVTRRW
jgi:hypothetical protein